MRNICGCGFFCDLEVFSEVLQTLGNTFAAVSRNFLATVSRGSLVTSRICWVQLISVTVLLAKLVKGRYGRSVLEDRRSDENMKIMHMNLRFFIRLDITICCNYC